MDNSPDSIAARLALGRALVEAGQVDEGLSHLAAAAERAPERRAVLRAYADGLATAGREVAAAAVLRRWARRTADARRLCKVAAALARSGHPGEALLALDRASAVAPEDGASFYARGQLQRTLGRLDEAIVSLTEAQRLAPDNRVYRRELHSAQFAAGRVDEAILARRQLVADAADDVPLRVGLADMLLDAGRPGDAVPVLEQAIAIDATRIDARIRLSRAFRALSRHDEALAATAAALRSAPQDVAVLGERVAAFTALGRHQEAADAHEQIAALRPGDAALLLRLVGTLVRARRPERALAVAETACAIAPDNAGAHHSRGDRLLALDAKDRAREAFERALELDPNHAGALAGLAKLNENAGDVETALALFDRAIAAAPSAGLLARRAGARYSLGDSDGARRDVEAALARDPNVPLAALYATFLKGASGTVAPVSIDICFIEALRGEPSKLIGQALLQGAGVVADFDGPPPTDANARRVIGDWRDRIAASSADYVMTMPGSVLALPDLAAFRRRCDGRVGYVGGDNPAASPCLWRRDLLLAGLAIFPTLAFADFAATLAPRLARRSEQPREAPPLPLASAPFGGGREAWLCAPEGARPVGGVERCLRDLVPIYRGLGYAPVLVGAVASMARREPEGEVDGIPFLNVGRSIGDLRRLALLRNPAFAHATAEVGAEIAAAFDGLAARLICEVNGSGEIDAGEESFERSDDETARVELGALLMRFDQVYASTESVAGFLRRHFGFSPQFVPPAGTTPPADLSQPGAARSEHQDQSRFPASALHRKVERMARAANRRIAVGVGCGVGNIVQCAPAIRRISEHFDAPVDVLLREDFPGSIALLEGSSSVASVILADRPGALPRFDDVLILEGFGTLLPHINGDRIRITRDHLRSDEIGDMPESRFNLICAERLLGVPFGEEDIGAYFVGDVKPAPVPRRIGIHAGCKPGMWLPKRWPFFPELSRSLMARGYEVISFGIRDEYVEGTVDATGGDLAATIRAIATCSYFVANDSGLMHIADALGVPLTAIFAPTSVERFGPIGPSSRVVRIARDCSPCQFDAPRMARCRCIGDISLEAVEEAVLAGLAALEGPPSVAA